MGIEISVGRAVITDAGTGGEGQGGVGGDVGFGVIIFLINRAAGGQRDRSGTEVNRADHDITGASRADIHRVGCDGVELGLREIEILRGRRIESDRAALRIERDSARAGINIAIGQDQVTRIDGDIAIGGGERSVGVVEEHVTVGVHRNLTRAGQHLDDGVILVEGDVAAARGQRNRALIGDDIVINGDSTGSGRDGNRARAAGAAAAVRSDALVFDGDVPFGGDQGDAAAVGHKILNRPVTRAGSADRDIAGGVDINQDNGHVAARVIQVHGDVSVGRAGGGDGQLAELDIEVAGADAGGGREGDVAGGGDIDGGVPIVGNRAGIGGQGDRAAAVGSDVADRQVVFRSESDIAVGFHLRGRQCTADVESDVAVSGGNAGQREVAIINDKYAAGCGGLRGKAGGLDIERGIILIAVVADTAPGAESERTGGRDLGGVAVRDLVDEAGGGQGDIAAARGHGNNSQIAGLAEEDASAAGGSGGVQIATEGGIDSRAACSDGRTRAGRGDVQVVGGNHCGIARDAAARRERQVA